MKSAKNVYIHLGPHKTGSSSIQGFLKQNAEYLRSCCDIDFIVGRDLAEIWKPLKEKKWDLAKNRLETLSQFIADSERSIVILSSEDFSGFLPGRENSGKVYPRLWQHMNVIRNALKGHECHFVFFVRDFDEWLSSVYFQVIKYGERFGKRSDFDAFVDKSTGWNSVLEKPRMKLGSGLIEVKYEGGNSEFSSVVSLMRLVGGNQELLDKAKSHEWENVSRGQDFTGVLEVINSSGASKYAQKSAKEKLFSKKKICTKGLEKTERLEKTENADWPPFLGKDTNIPELSSLYERVKSRVYSQMDQPNLLPRKDVDLSLLRLEMVGQNSEHPGKTRIRMENQYSILEHRFSKKPALGFLNALAISYLRRDTEHTDHARHIFFRLWEEEHDFLLGTLPTRWLISTMQTFLDHGKCADQKKIGAAGYFFANSVKAYESERSHERLTVDGIYPETVPVTPIGFPGLDRISVGNSDLLVNMLALLLEVSMSEEVSGRVNLEFLRRLKRAHSVFSRMDQTRLEKKVEISGFQNCWSFFEEPKSSS